jgi:DNA-binding NtrC family response regulator
MARVLLVDDELTMVQTVSELLRREGHEVFPFTNGAAAVAALTEQAPELVITDLYLDKTRAHGLEILQKARALNPPAVVIVITGFGSIDTAVEAMRNGAFDYLEKPFKVLQRRRLRNRPAPETAQEEISFQPDHRQRRENAGGVQDDRARGGHREHDPRPG